MERDGGNIQLRNKKINTEKTDKKREEKQDRSEQKLRISMKQRWKEGQKEWRDETMKRCLQESLSVSKDHPISPGVHPQTLATNSAR